MTVLDVVDAVDFEHAVVVIEASEHACQAMFDEVSMLHEAHLHDDAGDLMGNYEDLRRQAAVAAAVLSERFSDAGLDFPAGVWVSLGELDAVAATDW